MTPGWLVEGSVAGMLIVGGLALVAGVVALRQLGTTVLRNPLRDVPVWAFLVIPIGAMWYLGLPWPIWPIPLLVLYVLHVRLWPYAPCRWCGGSPKRGGAGAGTAAIRLCRHCNGKGLRVRWASLRSDAW